MKNKYGFKRFYTETYAEKVNSEKVVDGSAVLRRDY